MKTLSDVLAGWVTSEDEYRLRLQLRWYRSSEPELSTSRKRLSMHVSGTQEACNRAALLLILEFDQWDIQQGNYLDSDAFFEEIDREQSDEHARTFGER